MPIEGTVPAALFDGCPHISVRCPKHPNQTLMEWWWTDRDPAQTWVLNAPGFSQEYIGYQPDDDTRAAGVRIGLDFAVAPAESDDSPHFRFHLRCPQPACSYHWQGRDQTFIAAVTPLLPRLLETETPVFVIGDLDAFIRRAA